MPQQQDIVLWAAIVLAIAGVLLAIVGVMFDLHRWQRRRMHRRRVREVTVEDVWRSDAGAHLFNGLTRMDLLDTNGRPILFSRRRALHDDVARYLLDRGYMPRNLAPRIAPNPPPEPPDPAPTSEQVSRGGLW